MKLQYIIINVDTNILNNCRQHLLLFHFRRIRQHTKSIKFAIAPKIMYADIYLYILIYV